MAALWSTLAQAEWLQKGDPVELDSDEGLALFVVDSDSALSKVRLDHGGAPFTQPVLPDLAAGRHLRLLRLPAGDYRFDSLRLRFPWTEVYWKIHDIPNVSFRIEPGQLNYVGELRARGGDSRSITVRNALLAGLELLEHEQPGLSTRYPVRYTGDMPDPFADFLSTERKAHAEAAARHLTEPPLPAPSIAQRDLADVLYRQVEVSHAVLAPSGRHALVYARDGRTHVTRLIDLERGTSRVLYSGPTALWDLEWVNPQRLVLTYFAGTQKSNIVDLPEDGEPRITEITQNGFVLGMQPGGHGRGIFARPGRRGLLLYPVDLTRTPDQRDFRGKNEVRDEVLDDLRWWLDIHGTPRLAQVANRDTDQYKYYDEAGKAWDFSIPYVPNEQLQFVGFDRRNRLLVLTDRARPQVELVVYDPVTEQLGETVYREPGIDLSAVAHGFDRAIVGVQFVQGGQLRSRYFEAAEQKVQARIQKAFPGRNVEIGPATANGKHIVRTFGPTDPGSYYVADTRTNRIELLTTVAPHLDGRPMRAVERLVAKASDGAEIEAFLTRPDSTAPAPLLVMPHGGPIGVFDMQSFDRDVQYFAQLGYAVLQVNYRGSGNVGSAAQSAGHGQWGTGIEGDINAAVDAAIAAGGIDAQRVVALGTSYGGYSAIMLGVRWPERYKAAVSIGGVTDLPLQFSAGDITEDQRTIDALVKLLGDPRTQIGALRQVSPVYRYADIRRPLLLVHDRGDNRVAFEHARRLQAVLALRGQTPPLIAIHDEEHGLVESETAVATWPKIAAFLEQALKAPATGTVASTGQAVRH